MFGWFKKRKEKGEELSPRTVTMVLDRMADRNLIDYELKMVSIGVGRMLMDLVEQKFSPVRVNQLMWETDYEFTYKDCEFRIEWCYAKATPVLKFTNITAARAEYERKRQEDLIKAKTLL